MEGRRVRNEVATSACLHRPSAGFEVHPRCARVDEWRVVLLFPPFEKALTTPETETAPEYPGSQASDDERNRYWQWFAQKFDERDEKGKLKGKADRKALEIVESAVTGPHSVAWIDYRVPLNKDGPPFLHLHVAGRGEYDTATFAYQLIARGFKHGLRIVGTLKSEPDLNVLAVFER